MHAARRLGAALLLWAFVFSIFVNLLMLTGPLYLLQVYDRVLASRSVETLVALTVLMGALYGLMAVLEYARVSPVLPATMDAPWTRVFLATIFIFHPMLGWLAVGGAVCLVALTIINQVLTASMVRQSFAAEQKAQSFAPQPGDDPGDGGAVPAVAPDGPRIHRPGQ